jgi:uncharacterized paraquat-inducible protein A
LWISINPNAVACLSCGCDPRKGQNHCNSCGAETNPQQVICIKCGVALKNLHSSSISSSSDDGKMVAIAAYLTLIGFIIAVVQHGTNKTSLGAYHLRQVIGFMLTGVLLGIGLWIITIPMLSMSYNVIGIYATFVAIISFVSWIGLLVCVIISLINAINGRETPAPIFGTLY